jgi:hypothetical protein
VIGNVVSVLWATSIAGINDPANHDQDLIQPLAAIPSHPLALMLSAFSADTARHVGGGGPMPEVVLTHCS